MAATLLDRVSDGSRRRAERARYRWRQRRSYGRRALRTDLEKFLRANWPALAVLAALTVIVQAALAALVGTFVAGYLAGIVVMSALGGALAVCAANTGALERGSGNDAERAAANLLYAAQSRGFTWRQVSDFQPHGAGQNVDHPCWRREACC